MTLVATPGAANANSYCTVAQAKVLLNDRLDAASWIAAPLLEQEQSLIWATRLLEQKVRWEVTSTAVTQALTWPVDDAYDFQGEAIADNVIPVFLQRATAGYALALWAWQQTPQPGALRRFEHGALRLEFQSGAHTPLDRIPADVQAELRDYGTVQGSGRVKVWRV